MLLTIRENILSIRGRLCACTVALLCALLSLPVQAQQDRISGQLNITDWPLRTPGDAQIRQLKIDWSLDVGSDVLLLDLEGLWRLGEQIKIDGQRYPVCEGASVRAPVPDGCSSSATLQPVLGRFEVAAIVSSPTVYYALVRLPLPTSWSSDTSFETRVQIPWDQLFFKGLNSEDGSDFYTAVEARQIVADDFTLESLLLTDVEFSLAP